VITNTALGYADITFNYSAIAHTPQLPEGTYKKAGYQVGWVKIFDIVN